MYVLGATLYRRGRQCRDQPRNIDHSLQLAEALPREAYHSRCMYVFNRGEYCVAFAKRNPVTSLPQDLRQINRPLLERLSPTSAGLTGDDYVDAQTIKDEWVRRKARDMSRIGRRKLK
jgi:hypothetical protein